MVIEAKAGVSSEEVLLARCRLFFADFVRVVYGWEPRPHQVPWFEALQLMAEGRLKKPNAVCEGCGRGPVSCGPEHATNKLLIEAFAGSGKTTTLAQYAAWLLGRAVWRGQQVTGAFLSFSDKIAAERSKGVRDTLEENKRYRVVFPWVKPDKKSWGQEAWRLKGQGTGVLHPAFRAAGLTASILGLRFDTFLVLDDPHDPQEIHTPGGRERLWRDWADVVSKRISEATPVVGLTGRWAADDWPGRLREAEAGQWFIIKTPALDENDETTWPTEIVDGLLRGFSTEYLLEERVSDPQAFLTQRMVEPPSAEGDLFHTFVEGVKPDQAEVTGVYQFWDLAVTANKWSHHNAMVEFWQLKNRRVYVNYALNIRIPFRQAADLIISEHERAKAEFGDRVRTVLEDRHAAPGYSEFVKVQAGIRVVLQNINNRPLYERAASVAKNVEVGLLFFPVGWAAWKDMLYGQLRGYRGFPPDDPVAAFTLGLERFFPNRMGRRPHLPFASIGGRKFLGIGKS